MKIDEIADLWASHEATRFPDGHRTKKVGDSNLTVLESETAANIMTYIYTDGKLVGRRKSELKNQVETLAQAIEDMSGEAKQYFQKLKDIGEGVLKTAAD